MSQDNDFSQVTNQLSNLNSFSKKIQFLNQKYPRLGSGSGRVVYDIDNNKVLKLAKNNKGIAQNKVEVSISNDYASGDIIANVIDNSDDYSWIISEKTKKTTQKRIREITGVPNLTTLEFYLREFESGDSMFHIDEKDREILNDNEWVHDIKELMSNFNVKSGDLGRPSSYGEVNRNGTPEIVLNDYGLTGEVYNTLYAPKNRQYNLYEIIDMNRGGLYQEFSGDYNTNNRMWALQPYSVSDGDNVVNEDFIKFVENRNKYIIDKPIFNLHVLSEEYEKSFYNLKEYIDKSNNPQLFIENLIKLEEYLNKFNVLKNNNLLLEVDPEVKERSLDRNIADRIVNYVSNEMGVSSPKFVGQGTYGFAYEINDKILKITTDTSEVHSALELVRCKPNTIVDTYNVFKIIDNKTNASYFVIYQDNIKDKPKEKLAKLHNDFLNLLEKKGGDDLVSDYIKFFRKREFNQSDFDKFIKENIFYDNGLSDQEKNDIYNLIKGLGNIKRDLIDCNLTKARDFLNFENLGYKNGILTYFDVGGYIINEPSLPPENRIEINEDTTNLDLNQVKKISKVLADKLKLNQPEYIGKGYNGYAFDVGNDMIMKITSDKSEAVESLKIKNRNNDYISNIYGVYEIKPKVSEEFSNYYVILLEKLNTSNNLVMDLGNKFDRLNYIFKNIFDMDYLDVLDFTGEDIYENNKEKIDKYFINNPEDKEFFESLLNIRKEIINNNINSLDYLNPENLGYKKNNNLGFFDLGFGDFNFKTQQPEPLEIDERKKSYMDKSVEVSVKDKCKIGGLGNTSKACNQGDISNLNFKSIK